MVVTTLQLAGRVALVTGASGGIGAAIAHHLAGSGARVAVHGSRPESIRSLQFDFAVIPVWGDVVEDATTIVESVLQEAGRVDILVNNAGIFPTGSLLDLSIHDVAETVRVNLLGVAAMTAAAARVMQPGSAVCNIASIEAFGAPQMHSHYVASKAGVIGHTMAAAVELGPRGIRVNAVAPGLIERPDISTEWPEGVARWTAACPLGRLGTGSDVGAAVGFLVGPDAGWITGACLSVDGGTSIRSPW
jgi:NAD(P)-dependent dehydrogenase (short-subunit alcohol dehydrogenase family)